MNRNDGAVGDARKARESARQEAGDVEALALDEELCRYDDSLHHMEGTDDFPCWHCKAKARDVITSDWLARVIADAKAEAVESMAHLFRDMANETITRRTVIQLLSLRAESYRIEAAR